MKPRRESSKKWTSLPKEYIQQIHEVFTENFATHLKNSKLIVEGRIYPEEVILRVGSLENGRLRQINFEASLDTDPKALNAPDQILVAIDALASMMAEYYETGNSEMENGEMKDQEDDTKELESTKHFPQIWQKIEIKKKTLWVQFSTENSELEAQANKLLNNLLDGNENLVNLEEDPEDNKEELAN